MKIGDTVHHGDACVTQMSLMTSESGALNRFSAWVFRDAKRTKFLYPFMRAGRNATLWIRGKDKIHQAEA